MAARSVAPAPFTHHCRQTMPTILQNISSHKAEASQPEIKGRQADTLRTYAVFGPGFKGVSDLSAHALTQGAPQTTKLVGSLFAVQPDTLQTYEEHDLAKGITTIALKDPNKLSAQSLIQKLSSALLLDSQDDTNFFPECLDLDTAIQTKLATIVTEQNQYIKNKDANCASDIEDLGAVKKGCTSCASETSCHGSTKALEVKLTTDA